jgi:hypothetical protein
MDMGGYTWEEICSLYFEGATLFLLRDMQKFVEMVMAGEINYRAESPTDKAFLFFVGLGEEFRKKREVAT